jgi:transposase
MYWREIGFRMAEVIYSMRIAPAVVLTEEQKQQLLVWSRGRRTPARVVRRAQIVLLASAGKQNKPIAEELGIMPRIAALWRARFLQQGLAGLERDAPRSGRKPSLSAAKVRSIVRKTTQEEPRGATQWSTRTMAKAFGVSEKTVRRIWKRHGLKPHLSRTFKVSNDPLFAEKLEDVVGLYLDPPEHAIVFSVDEKSQIQALDRTQPGLPMKKGRCGTMTHDYKRHGTTTLFAALNTIDGSVLASCMRRHRHEEWLRLLRKIERSVPDDKDIHIIADNYATHKHPNVRRWLERHPRVHVHFTPTSSSWLNMVERFFRDLTTKRLRRGVFTSVQDLELALHDYVRVHNQNPKPFIWTKTATDILQKVTRARKAADKYRSE